MSLDVTLYSPTKERKTCFYCGSEHDEKENVFSANITHNLNSMAEEAGIYKHLWRPEEIDIVFAKELIDPLQAGVALMESDPERFKAFNAKNGWGTYVQFLPWIKAYLNACIENPEAEISVSR